MPTFKELREYTESSQQTVNDLKSEKTEINSNSPNGLNDFTHISRALASYQHFRESGILPILKEAKDYLTTDTHPKIVVDTFYKPFMPLMVSALIGRLSHHWDHLKYQFNDPPGSLIDELVNDQDYTGVYLVWNPKNYFRAYVSARDNTPLYVIQQVKQSQALMVRCFVGGSIAINGDQEVKIMHLWQHQNDREIIEPEVVQAFLNPFQLTEVEETKNYSIAKEFRSAQEKLSMKNVERLP